MIYTTIALEIARDRAREAELIRLEREARAARRGTNPRRIRTLVARPFRVFSDASQAVADAACTAATRIAGSEG